MALTPSGFWGGLDGNVRTIDSYHSEQPASDSGELKHPANLSFNASLFYRQEKTLIAFLVVHIQAQPWTDRKATIMAVVPRSNVNKQPSNQSPVL